MREAERKREIEREKAEKREQETVAIWGFYTGFIYGNYMGYGLHRVM